MVLLALFGCLMCNVLLAWATLHQPYISTPRQTLSSPPPQNKNDWVHLVIFEPQPEIELTRSSYKVTSFLDFQPFLKGFQSVNEYLKDLTRDINNPNYFQRIVSPFSNFQITPLSNESIIWQFLSSPACKVNPYGCKSKLKLEQYQLEIQYAIKVFRAIYKKFLTAIDHIRLPPCCKYGTPPKLRGVKNIICMEIVILIPGSLTPSEENFLDEFLKALNKRLTHPCIKI